MLCFGVVCLAKGDEDSACGPGGTGGGISMTVMSSFVIGFLMVRAANRGGRRMGGSNAREGRRRGEGRGWGGGSTVRADSIARTAPLPGCAQSAAT